MRYKVGDIVYLRTDLRPGKYGNDIYTAEMCYLKYKPLVIIKIINNKRYKIEDSYFKITDEMIDHEKVRTEGVTLNESRRILLSSNITVSPDNETELHTNDGKTYKATCSEEDAFDIEKGIMIVLLKGFGVSWTELEELFEQTKYKDWKPKSGEKYYRINFARVPRIEWVANNGFCMNKLDLAFGNYFRREKDACDKLEEISKL